mmetsp:Transcript_21194/g.60232  ORF Transcript_21194/g.60232 Transcript_21194/m.60232 type:complete len:992 (+) Transcript_21194:80-3055(+)
MALTPGYLAETGMQPVSGVACVLSGAEEGDFPTASSSSKKKPVGKWHGASVRETFIKFFQEKCKHSFVPSSPVVPHNDPTLLFINAGMNQFKPIFVGQIDPSHPFAKLKRAANSQKCIRAGGKHNDLEDVGKDVYHHTFFEMLGNWSFGDYFKEEAIDMAWQLLTEVYELEPENLYASYFAGDEELGLPPDEEARALWARYLPESQILPFDKSDNFWEMGATGPCGPCSELHYDRIGGRDASSLVNMDDPDVLEIWNLVFMQFYREEDGSLTPLPNKHIDTGAGFERILSILQNKRSNYDSDLFTPLFEAVHAQVGGLPYGALIGEEDKDLRDMAYRVIVDHARCLTVAVADGAEPSSEGRGYVLRRILRRAVRYGRQMLSAPPGFFSKLVPAVVATLGPGFPELAEAADRVQEILRAEEEAFDQTIERGMQFFGEIRAGMESSGSKVVDGQQAFLLYDSHGFPLDLTQQMAEEAGLTVDVAAFERAMEDQKERSREALRQQQADKAGIRPLTLVAEQTSWLQGEGIDATLDAQKYDTGVAPSAVVRAIFSDQGFVRSTGELAEGATVGLVLDRTSFYAESGGQAPDLGRLVLGDGSALEVRNVQSYAGYVLHSGLASPSAPLEVGQEVVCEVDYAHRARISANHTTTHVVNWALREVLGDGADQRGSFQDAERLRFDFSAGKVTTAQVQRVEELVQGIIAEGVPVSVELAPLAAASEIGSLRNFAGDIYPDPVRVVTVGDATVEKMLADPASAEWRGQAIEFCGGTHLTNMGQAEAFVILEETSVSAGIRRIVGGTGEVAKRALELTAALEDRLASLEAQGSPGEAEVVSLGQELEKALISASAKPLLIERLGKLRKQLKKAQKKAKGGASKAQVQAARARVAEAAAAAQGPCAVVCLDGLDAKALGAVADSSELSIALLLLAESDGKVNCVATVPDAQQSDGKADAWVRAALEPLGGRGGGRPNRAQGSAPAEDGGLAKAEAAAAAFWA